MGKIAIVTDSNSGITQDQARELGISVIPMPFYINEKLYLEGITLSQEEFYEKLKKDEPISTSQPSPADLCDLWDKLLRDYEEIVHIPMSSGLSASCSTAMGLAIDYNGRVQVVDNQRISVTQRQSVMDAKMLAEAGKSAAEIKKILTDQKLDSSIYITLDTLKYLKKGGRVSSVTALAADVLNIKPVMHFSTGTLDTYQKCRGMKKARKVMIDAMKHELETNFREEYEAGNVYLMAASSSTDEVTAEWMAQIKESFPGIEIVDIRYSYDDEWVASKIVEEFLELYPELTGIYITGHGVKGVCQTLQKLGKDKTMHVIANDFLEENLKEGMCLGFDGRTVSAEEAETLEKILQKKQVHFSVNEDLIGNIWDDRPALSCEPVMELSEKWAGRSRADKIREIRSKLKEKGTDLFILTSLDDIAWLLNIRGNDIDYVPVVLSYLVLNESAYVYITISP